MQQREDVAGVILAGGLGRRMGGASKALLRVGGERMVDRLLGVLRPLFAEVCVAVRDPAAWSELGLPLALDVLPERCSLAGIHAGLASVRAGRAFCVAGDVPFLRPELVRLLLEELDADPGADVVVPCKEDGYLEPLCAIYSKACLPHIEERLHRGDRKITSFFHEVRVRAVPAERLREADPEFLSFQNTNTPEELELARSLLGLGAP
jgi:molybdopterin-guanine dinucleotide biosynthesis protein A